MSPVWRVYNINDISYLAESCISHADLPGLLPQSRPLVLVNPPTSSIEAGQDVDLALVEDDDVLQYDFWSTMRVLWTSAEATGMAEVEEKLASNLAGRSSITRLTLKLDESIGHNLYVLEHQALYSLKRLYDDTQNAFVVAIQPSSPEGTFRNLRLSGEYYSSLSVAVPSRLKSVGSKKGKLSGARFAVKDIFAIAGLKTTAGCRAWYDTSKPATTTAPALQALIDAGAELLGTLKLGSLITREEPTESADYHAAFNPRGDGYQSAWSSSGGSGAAIAAYNWLDFTIATDTTGSSRRPAMANGIFQMRLTSDILPMDGVVPSWKSIFDLERWVGAWISQESRKYQKLPITIVYVTDFFPTGGAGQRSLIESYVEDLETVHRVKREELSIRQLWKEKKPEEADEDDLERYLGEVGVNSFCYGVYHELGGFRKGYREKFGKEPYVNPVMKWRWSAVQNVTREQHEDAMARLRVYKEWLLRELLRVGERHCILPLPIAAQGVDYRDVPPSPPSAPNAFDAIWLAPILGAPEVSVPIGEVRYESEVSGRIEHLPIVISLLGAPGTDMELLNFARHSLEASGRNTSVTTGRRIGVADQHVRDIA